MDLCLWAQTCAMDADAKRQKTEDGYVPRQAELQPLEEIIHI